MGRKKDAGEVDDTAAQSVLTGIVAVSFSSRATLHQVIAPLVDSGYHLALYHKNGRLLAGQPLQRRTDSRFVEEYELDPPGDMYFRMSRYVRPFWTVEAMAIAAVSLLLAAVIGRALWVVRRFATQRRDTERKLQLSEGRYRMLAENVTDVIWTMTLDGEFSFVSPSVERVLGHTPEELKAMSLEGALMPESYAEALRILESQIAFDLKLGQRTQKPLVMRLLHRCKSGPPKWCEDATLFLRDNKGRAVGVIGVTRDISDRMRVEQELRQSEQKFRSIAEQNMMGIIILQDGIVGYANPVVQTILGYSPEEFLGAADEDLMQIFHPDDRDAVRDVYRRLSQEGAGAGTDRTFRLNKKTGDVVWIEQFARSVQHEGRPALYITMVDVTGRKIAEERLLKHQQDLRSLSSQLSLVEERERRLIAGKSTTTSGRRSRR
ncbi:MAG: PAS domain S-box protein [Deltaproteobacteria bacterium]|nr:PAS domain S-box protein [Deltaproteobacteria bacterium]